MFVLIKNGGRKEIFWRDSSNIIWFNIPLSVSGVGEDGSIFPSQK